MRQYIYVSTAPNLTSEDIASILESCQRNNAARDVTGLLLYNGRNFLQLLEGNEADLLWVMSRIGADPRHSGISKLEDMATAKRACPDWMMRHIRLVDDIAQRRGFTGGRASKAARSAIVQDYPELRGVELGLAQAVPADSDTLIVASLVSRVEALCLASALEANGIAVHVDGSYHASVEVNSWVLGGHRLRIAAADYQAASDLMRELGSEDNWEFSTGLQRAVVRLIVFWAIVFVAPSMVMIGVGVSQEDIEPKNPFTVLLPIFSLISLPVNPQGHGDYYLAPAVD